MISLRPHIWGLCVLVFSAVLYVGATPVVGYWLDAERQQTGAMEADTAQTQQSVQMLEDDVAAAQKLSSQLDPKEIERLLAPVDRLKVATLLEHQAAASHMQNFAYTLAPEQRVTFTTPGAGPQQLAQSEITVSADAALDTETYTFVEHLRTILPGRLHLRAFTIERIGDAQTALASTNVHMT